MYPNFRIFSLSLFVFITFSARGQQNTRSPYSLFGVGLLHYEGFADNSAIGRNGGSYRYESNFSFVNPASLSALSNCAFNVGAFMDMGKFKTKSLVQSFSNAGLGYITLGVPLKGLKGGFVFGLLPYSDVGYNIINVKDSAGVSVRNEFEGNGGLSRFSLGFGTKIWKYASVGFNYSSIFGQMDESAKRRYPGSIAILSYTETNNLLLRGHRLDLGLQLHSIPDSGLNHVLGVVFSNKSKLKGESERFGATYIELGGNDYIKDTILRDTVSKKMTLPTSLNLSYTIGNHEKWQVSVGYSKTMWSRYRNIFGDNGGLGNCQSYSVGGFICPNPVFDKTLKSDKFIRYLKSIRYSAGFYHNDGYITALGNKISESSLSVGFGFPFYKKILQPDGKVLSVTSRIFITGEFIRRGTTNDDLIREDFLRLTLGLNFADSWFRKRKFN